MVSGGRIPYVFDPDLPGNYNRIFDLMAEKLDRPVEIRYFSMSQAMQQLAEPEFDCFAMGLKNSLNWARLGMEATDYTFIGPIAWLEVRAYVRADAKVSDVESLTEQPIAADMTIANLYKSFDQRWALADIIRTGSFVEALDQLVAGEVSVALAYDVDVRALGESHRLAGQFVDTGVVVSEQQDGIVCKSTPELLPVILGLQEGLDRITADGTLSRLLGEPE